MSMIERLKRATWGFWLNVVLTALNVSAFLITYSIFSLALAVFCGSMAWLSLPRSR